MRKVKFAKNNIYHIYNRGVEKRDIFLGDNDRWRFLQGLFLFNDLKTSASLLWDLERAHGTVTFSVLREYFGNKREVRKPIVRILADCLMPNHYHLLVEELEDGGVTKFMHKLGTGYTNYFNEKYNRVGSLFQGPFKAILVDDDIYLQYLLIYINVVNPGQLIRSELGEGDEGLRAIMKFAKEYPWSTHQEYLAVRESIIIDKGVLAQVFSTPKQYEEFVFTVLPQKEKFEDIHKPFS